MVVLLVFSFSWRSDWMNRTFVLQLVHAHLTLSCIFRSQRRSKLSVFRHPRKIMEEIRNHGRLLESGSCMIHELRVPALHWSPISCTSLSSACPTLADCYLCRWVNNYLTTTPLACPVLIHSWSSICRSIICSMAISEHVSIRRAGMVRCGIIHA
jgi:hypothetical protein